MSTTHTPGPWIIDRGSDFVPEGPKPLAGHCVAGVMTSFGSITIRATATAGQKCPSCDQLDAIGEANAALIIAAPDLLAFAKWARDQFCGDSGTGYTYWEENAEFMAGMKAIDSATISERSTEDANGRPE